jgi:hypothetical protein
MREPVSHFYRYIATCPNAVVHYSSICSLASAANSFMTALQLLMASSAKLANDIGLKILNTDRSESISANTTLRNSTALRESTVQGHGQLRTTVEGGK